MQIKTFKTLYTACLLGALALTQTGCFKKKEVKPPAPKALIVVTSHSQLGDSGTATGWYLSEVSHVYYPLIEAGFEVDFASPQGGEAPMDPKSHKPEDALNKRFLDDAGLMQKMKETKKVSEVSAQDYKVLHFAGGHGTMWDFPDSAEIQKLTRDIYENGGIVGAICHGPAALVNTKLSNGTYLVAGKKLTSFTDAEEYEAELHMVVPFLLETQLRLRDAEFESGLPWEDHVVVSERLITGQNPQSGHSYAKKIIETYKNMKAQEEAAAKAAAEAEKAKK